jgi:hypothetical protein
MTRGLGRFFLPPKTRNNIMINTIKAKKLDESPTIPPAANAYFCVLSIEVGPALVTGLGPGLGTGLGPGL